MKKALVIGCSNNTISELRQHLSQEYRFEVLRDIQDLSADLFEAVFVRLETLELELQSLSDKCYRTSLQQIWKSYPEAKVIVIAASDSIRRAVRAVRAGADDYLTLPIESQELDLVLKKAEAVELQAAQIQYFDKVLCEKNFLSSIQTESPLMEEVLEKVSSVADKTATVLLTGETGVGKGVVARLIHESSSRSGGPFISVHCGAISENLVESELFGHEKGAFTGAIKRKLGKFELANSGTIFLDEIGTITPSAQVKLLQVLQDSLFQRVGGEEDIKVDIRIIAATNEDLKNLSDKDLFRKDLFFRLNVFPIHLPALRERIEDLPELLNLFMKRFSQIHQKEIYAIGPDVIESLSKYDWPGNIRELENLVERACILEKSDKLQLTSFPIEVTGKSAEEPIVAIESNLSLSDARQRLIENFEKKYLNELLMRFDGKIKEVANHSGVGVRQVHKLLSKYGLIGREYRSSGKGSSHNTSATSVNS